MQTISLSVCICQFCINFWLPKRFMSHLEEANEVIMFAGVTGRDLCEQVQLPYKWSIPFIKCGKTARFVIERH